MYTMAERVVMRRDWAENELFEFAEHKIYFFWKLILITVFQTEMYTRAEIVLLFLLRFFL